MRSLDSLLPNRPHRRLLRRLLVGPLAVVAIGVMAFSVIIATSGTAQGATIQTSTVPVSTSPKTIKAGEELYIAHCQSCHGVDGVGNAKKAIPELISAGAAAADFYLTTGRMPSNDPRDIPIRNHPYFNATQIRQLDAYIAALPKITHTNVHGPIGAATGAAPGIPYVEPVCRTGQKPSSGCVTLAEGEQNFQLNCAACHQIAGAGDILSKGALIPTLRNATPLQVAEAARIGPRPMPIFGPKTLTDAQVSSIARYVQYLKHPANRGGLPLGHFGPVPEGFVAILIGFGACLFIARLIGNRG